RADPGPRRAAARAHGPARSIAPSRGCQPCVRIAGGVLRASLARTAEEPEPSGPIYSSRSGPSHLTNSATFSPAVDMTTAAIPLPEFRCAGRAPPHEL